MEKKTITVDFGICAKFAFVKMLPVARSHFWDFYRFGEVVFVIRNGRLSADEIRAVQ